MRVLLTGATGYIGRRLMARLAAEDGVNLRLFVRSAAKLQAPAGSNIEIAEGSTFDKASLAAALGGVETAYYLIHSMGSEGDFTALERRSAENFRDACIAAGVRRIVYLGGLGDKDTASRHLLSRIETGEILSGRPDRIQTLWFRAGIIIGSGSASFEIIRNLVQKLPILVTPKWVLTRTQPISVENVLDYLEQARTLPADGNLVVDIGSEIMSFKDMLFRAAAVMGLRRRLIRVPLFTPKLSSYWLILMTPVPFGIAKELVEGLRSETVARNDNARVFFPSIALLSYEQAMAAALEDIERHQVLSRWCDSTARETCDLDVKEKTSDAVYTDRTTMDFGDIPPAAVFRSVMAIGGRRGWLALEPLWRIRGWMDKLGGGPGLNRGRRDPVNLRIGDGLDFWKVLDLQPGQRLLLLAQMKVSGRAWLEFAIQGTTLVQTAYFLPQGLWGRLYWYSMKPAHAFIFKKLARRIIEQARAAEAISS
jgi:uncharacterized protein YbjT (DUF2867 family)